MKKTMVVNTKLDVIDYANMVDSLVDGYFDENGDYQPHIGRLNAIRLFYNKCIIKSRFDLPHDFEDALMINFLIENKKFVKAFNKALKPTDDSCLDFYNAYSDALKIVETKRNSLSNIIDNIKKFIQKASDTFNNSFGDDNISELKNIVSKFATSNFSPDVIASALSNLQ